VRFALAEEGNGLPVIVPLWAAESSLLGAGIDVIKPSLAGHLALISAHALNGREDVASSDTMLTRCRRGASQPPETRSITKLIDRIRHDIQQRIDQLLAEADKLRHALAALDPRGRSTPKPKPASQPTSKRAAKTLDAPKQTPTRGRTRTASTTTGASASTRTPPGETKAKVLGALSSDQALTAGDVAKTTGLARSTVSTTLSKLAKSGEVVKADRGYRLSSTEGGTPSAAEPTATPATDA